MTGRRKGSTHRCPNCPPYEYCAACWQRQKDKQNAKVRDRRAKGLCIWCGEPAAPSRVSKVGAYCLVHKKRRHVWHKTYKVRTGTPSNDSNPLELTGTHVKNRV